MDKEIFMKAADIAEGVCSFTIRLQSTVNNTARVRTVIDPNIIKYMENAQVAAWA